MLKTYFRYFIIHKLTIWLIFLFITFFAIHKTIHNITKHISFQNRLKTIWSQLFYCVLCFAARWTGLRLGDVKKENNKQLRPTACNGHVAQLEEHRAFNLMAVGSSPAVPNHIREIIIHSLLLFFSIINAIKKNIACQ